jgi:RNA polymerase sigma-70 factor (ECF subfamily)
MAIETRVEPRDSSETDEAAIVRRARAGDPSAFALLVERHTRPLLRTALRLLGRMDLAQDAVQETFMRVHRYLARFDESRPLAPWLYRVVVNVARDVGRRSSTPRLVPLDSLTEGQHPATRVEAGTLDEPLAREEQRRMVQAALLTLPAKERAAIVLRDIEGLSTREVAQALGSSEGTVRSQICTARLKIKRFIERRGAGRP